MPCSLNHPGNILFVSLSHRVLVLGGTRTHNLLIFRQTPKPSRLGAQQEDGFLPRVLKWKVQWIQATQALRITGAQANFHIFLISEPQSFCPGCGSNTQPSYL